MAHPIVKGVACELRNKHIAHAHEVASTKFRLNNQNTKFNVSNRQDDNHFVRRAKQSIC